MAQPIWQPQHRHVHCAIFLQQGPSLAYQLLRSGCGPGICSRVSELPDPAFLRPVSQVPHVQRGMWQHLPYVLVGGFKCINRWKQVST